MPQRYDDATAREAVSDMQKVAEIAAEIRELKQKLDYSRGPEEDKQIRDEIKSKSVERQGIIDTFDEKYKVSKPKELDIVLREQGVNYRQGKPPQRREGEEGHSEKSTQGHDEQSVVMVKKEDIEAVEQCVKNMRAAQESNNYIALQEESNKILEISQRISHEMEENRQRMEAVRENNHGNTQIAPQYEDLKNLNHGELIRKLLREHGNTNRGRDRTR